MSHTPQQFEQSSSERRPTYLFSTVNDLPEETRVPVVRQLNQSLADTTDLATQMKVAHWNVKGIHFYQLHLLFDEIAETLQEHADILAERATALGGQAMGTVRMAASSSNVPELSTEAVTGEKYLRETTEHLAVHAANLRSSIDYAANCGDEDTADLYTELSREVDKQLYFLESHLQTEPVDVIGESGAAPQGAAPGYPSTEGQGGGGPPQQHGTAHQGAPQRVTFGGASRGGMGGPEPAGEPEGRVPGDRPPGNAPPRQY